MKVFADFHHDGLYNSLSMLFEDRLGYELYRPIGIDWYTEGYWHIFPHPATAKQYLDIYGPNVYIENLHGKPLLPMEKVNAESEKIDDHTYLIRRRNFGRYHKGITLERFKEEDFDLLISSIPPHIEPYSELIKLYHPKAKHIFQVGNSWGYMQNVKNILSSTAPYEVPDDINIVYYHQEFDLNLFSYVQPTSHTAINSYIHYMHDVDKVDEIRLLLQDWNINTYGAGMPKCLNGMDVVSQAYKDSAFTWQYKPGGDGYGYGIFCSYACGRPAIVWKSHYQGKLAEKFLIPDKTYIEAEGLTPEELANKLLYFSTPEKHKELCQNAYERFTETVNFDEDFERIKLFLERLR
jgi:hypothetical protein